MVSKSMYIHPKALVETQSIGEGTLIWAFAHIMENVKIGNSCNICDHCFIESGVVLGNGVTVKNGVSIWEGVFVEDEVFIGPNVVFTNEIFPRSTRVSAPKEASDKSWLIKTTVSEGVSIGANATIKCGVTLGKYCMIGAGSVVTKDIPPYTLVYGVPAEEKGKVNGQGVKLVLKDKNLWEDPLSHKLYTFDDDELKAVDP